MERLLVIRDENRRNRKEKRKSGEKYMPEKCVVVSQWTQMLLVVERHLREKGVACATIKGSVQPKERTQLVDTFNMDPDGPQVVSFYTCTSPSYRISCSSPPAPILHL